jgi:hypothetical protein
LGSDRPTAKANGSQSIRLATHRWLASPAVSFAVSFAQLVLTLVFAVAAAAKLADRPATRGAIEAFGAPTRLAAPGAVLLSVVEMAIAVCLALAATAFWGALGAMVVLGIFSLAILRTLRAGSAPDCNCFGGLTQTEVGRGTLVRNGVLAAVAAFVALSGQAVSALAWVTVPAARDRVGIAFLLAGLVALGWFCWQLLQQNGRLLRRLEAEDGPAGDLASLPPLKIGTPAPAFEAEDLNGETVSLRSLLAPGLPVALIFTDPGCGACAAALEVVADAQRERAGELTLAVISSGSIDRIKAKAAEFGLDRVIPQADNALFDAYRVHGYPGIVEIDATGAVAAPPALGAAAIDSVVSGPTSRPPHERIEVVAR